MADLYRFVLNEDLLEINLQDLPQDMIILRIVGVLEVQEGGQGNWADYINVNARLEVRADEILSLEILKQNMLNFMAAFHTKYSANINSLTTWLDETEFTEEDLTVPDWPPEEEE